MSITKYYRQINRANEHIKNNQLYADFTNQKDFGISEKLGEIARKNMRHYYMKKAEAKRGLLKTIQEEDYKYFKDNCVSCGKDIYPKDHKNKAQHYEQYGNFCIECSVRASKNEKKHKEGITIELLEKIFIEDVKEKGKKKTMIHMLEETITLKNSEYCDILRKKYGEKEGNKKCEEYLIMIKNEKQSKYMWSKRKKKKNE